MVIVWAELYVFLGLSMLLSEVKKGSEKEKRYYITLYKTIMLLFPVRSNGR